MRMSATPIKTENPHTVLCKSIPWTTQEWLRKWFIYVAFWTCRILLHTLTFHKGAAQALVAEKSKNTIMSQVKCLTA